jgi:hypothetical protein
VDSFILALVIWIEGVLRQHFELFYCLEFIDNLVIRAIIVEKTKQFFEK